MGTVSANSAQTERLAGIEGIQPFKKVAEQSGNGPLRSHPVIDTLQMNTGRRCNLTCKHCHVDAGPDRPELMDKGTMSDILNVLRDRRIPVLDITGGAPELNPHTQWFIKEAAQYCRRIMLRTNLVIWEHQAAERWPEFCAAHRVEVVTSLPYYSERDVDRQRGDGVFQAVLKQIKKLNELGYGRQDGGLSLDLVYNPGGAYLPAPQQALEADYRRVLADRYGLSFDGLFALGNFPVGRFLSFLEKTDNLDPYMRRLSGSFNPATLANLMCRKQVSVRWDGKIFDCDFNQMLDLPCANEKIGEARWTDLLERDINVHNHCYACTAGSGSSCGGAVV